MEASDHIEALLNKKQREREELQRQIDLVNAEISGLDQAMQAIKKADGVRSQMKTILEAQATR